MSHTAGPPPLAPLPPRLLMCLVALVWFLAGGVTGAMLFGGRDATLAVGASLAAGGVLFGALLSLPPGRR